jgi:hypothetical protein
VTGQDGCQGESAEVGGVDVVDRVDVVEMGRHWVAEWGDVGGVEVRFSATGFV